MQQYLRELNRQPYYSSKLITPSSKMQQKLAFDAAAQFEQQQRIIAEKRAAEYEFLQNHGGDLTAGDYNNRIVDTITNTYVQPDGISFYFQPDGMSYYLQP